MIKIKLIYFVIIILISIFVGMLIQAEEDFLGVNSTEVTFPKKQNYKTAVEPENYVFPILL